MKVSKHLCMSGVDFIIVIHYYTGCPKTSESKTVLNDFIMKGKTIDYITPILLAPSQRTHFKTLQCARQNPEVKQCWIEPTST